MIFVVVAISLRMRHLTSFGTPVKVQSSSLFAMPRVTGRDCVRELPQDRGATSLETPALPYEPSLDSVRAFSIVAVVFYHAFTTVPGGWIGVDAFFVLSGYLITRILAEEMRYNGRLDVFNFCIRRVLRLVPAFALMLAAELTFEAIMSNEVWEHIEAAALSATYLMNWNRAFAFGPQGHLGHTWSLAMEEQFYLLWPAALIIVRKRPIPSLVITILAVVSWRCWLAIQGADPERTYNGFDSHADALLIGCLTAYVPLSAELKSVLTRNVWMPVIGLTLLLVYSHFRTIFTQTAGLTLAAAFAAWIIVAATQHGLLNRFLRLPPLVYTGRISYGLYLWHFPILLAGLSVFSLSSAVDKLLLLCVAYAVAALSYHFVERPFLKLKSKFAPRDRPPSDSFFSEAQPHNQRFDATTSM